MSNMSNTNNTSNMSNSTNNNSSSSSSTRSNRSRSRSRRRSNNTSRSSRGSRGSRGKGASVKREPCHPKSLAKLPLVCARHHQVLGQAPTAPPSGPKSNHIPASPPRVPNSSLPHPHPRLSTPLASLQECMGACVHVCMCVQMLLLPLLLPTVLLLLPAYSVSPLACTLPVLPRPTLSIISRS